MPLRHAPAGWSPARIAAFNTLIEAAHAYVDLRDLIAALNITDAAVLARRNELGQHIVATLLPTFRNT